MDESIDLRQLRYFVAVSEELNFRRAAVRLHISQPPLSRQIRQLEDQLGVPLFERRKAGVVLTEAGTAFLPEVKRTLRQAERAIAAARTKRPADGGQFVVGYTTVFDRSAIPDVLDRLQRRFPLWRLVARGKHSIGLVRDLESGAVDAAFIGLHTETGNLKVATVFEEPLVVALPGAHRLARKRRITFDDLRDEPMFWFARRLNPGFHDHCRAFFERIAFEPRIVPEPADHHVLLGLIAEGRGLALISASLKNVRRKGVVFRALDPGPMPLTMGIAVAWSERNASPLLGPFLRLVKTRAAAPRPSA